ncbi:DUF4232 domain-containing protein [Streptomyces sp. NPDC088794]|uniref:DUF4232 domain-containing protein n=1 Tax=Streptomyces sp. NPDC088794 TaxID=3365902 RepID=UPI00381BDA3C
MRYVNGMRGSAMVVLVASAALAVAGCQPGEDGADSADGGVSPSAPATSAPVSATPAPGGSAPTCSAGSLKATARQAAVRPAGTGTGAAVVEFTNVSAQTCVLKGHPTVAGAGNGSPEMNVPLTVKPTGAATSVKVSPGGKAWVKLTFVQVQGEADGYCVSGSAPVLYPTMVVRLPGSGAHQVALDDGQFAECDDTVTVTAVAAVQPS